MSGNRSIRLIGNAHIDPVWLWQWTEGREEVLSTCRAAVELLDEDPAFVFSRSSAATYEWIEEQDPELFERIRGLIAAGRWAIVGGWWEQPDCNVPSGESLCRQALYGKRWFLDRFGVEVTVGYNVDTFGHPATLPQILLRAGLDSYCFFRPGEHEMHLPGVFRWRAPDGSEVLTCRPEGIYATGPDDIEDRIRSAAGTIQPPLTSTLCFYGVGNHGGGPTRRNLASIHRLQEDPELPELILSGPEPFFREAREHWDALPVVASELQHHARGCYAAVSAIKAEMRRAERLLLEAERWASVSGALGLEIVPTEDFAAGWKRVLFNQFHDILAGTSIRPACDEALEDLAEAQAIAKRRMRESLHRIASRADTSGPGQPLVVANSVAQPRRELVVTSLAAQSDGRAMLLVDDTGQEVAAEIGQPFIHTRSCTYPLAFVAEAPALGYRVYRLVPGEPTALPEGPAPTAEVLETTRYRLTIDPESGLLGSLIDKSLGRELLSAPGNRLAVIRDESDTWSHDTSSFWEEVGQFAPVAPPRLVHSGALYTEVELTLGFGASRATQRIRIVEGSARIEFHTTVDWHERHHVLKVAFPLATEDPTATFEVAYGHVTRATTGEEEPVHRWLDVSEGAEWGVALLNDSKYGCDVQEGEMRLTLLRSPIFAFHDPQRPLPGQIHEYVDQGPQEFAYALVPHAGTWADAGIVAEASAFQSPLRAQAEAPHQGPWQPARSFLSTDAPNLALEVLKGAEDGDGFVLRGYETDGRECQARIGFLGEELGAVSLGPNEIRTWKLVRPSGYWGLVECDTLERPLHRCCCEAACGAGVPAGEEE